MRSFSVSPSARSASIGSHSLQAIGRLVLGCTVAVAISAPAGAQTLQPSDLTYKGAYTIKLNGNNSTYGQGLTSRHVNGQLRFLHLSSGGRLDEFAAPSAYGGTVTSPLRSWTLGGIGVLDNINGIWFEEAKNRLWVTSATDYTATYQAAHIATMTLNDSGTVSGVHIVQLAGVPERRTYGGCQPSPLAGYAYVCGWGGYASLMMNAGAVSLGPTMYAIPDPANTPAGGTITPKVILDASNPQAKRGLRATIPQNYFDGGDPRPNPSTRPTSPTASGAAWLSPNAQGNGSMVWGDSYYNTGMLIPGRGFLMVASLCKGSCWYQSSSLSFDGRQFEWHIWDSAVLTGANVVERPTSMKEFTLPNRGGATFQGNTQVENIGGATYADGSVFLMSCGGNGTIYQYGCGLFQFAVAGAGTTPPVGDTTAPTVSVTGPSGGGVVSGTVSLSANAGDNVGVLGVWFTVDGVAVGAEDVTSPYQGSWNAAGVAVGSHVVLAMARDAAGNTTTSLPITVSVQGSTPPPVSSITLTTAIVQCSVTLVALPPNSTGGWSVRFQRNGAAIGQSDSTAPYSQTVTTGAGLSTFGAIWTKTGNTSVSAPLVASSCP